MAFLTELDVVNSCLGTLGELPVNALDDEHPLIAAARKVFKEVCYREQARQWWFNTEIIDLKRDADSFIYVPQDAIRCDPVDDSKNFIQRGRRLYDPEKGKNTYVMDRDVTCWLVRFIPFEDLPVVAATAVNYATQLSFMQSYDADMNKYQQIGRNYADAYALLNAEHIRNADANLLHRNSTLNRMLNIGLGSGRFTGQWNRYL